jgi:RimK family alpha-L-glutamate ligase
LPARHIALFIDAPDWHAEQLEAAFAQRGATAHALRLADCGFDTTRGNGLILPGPWAPDGLPDAVLVRGVDTGSFEQVTKRLSVLHALDALGVKVWNSARAIERCVDKAMTAFLLARASIATPPSWTVEGREAAASCLAAQGGTLVLKPLFGAQGRGLLRIQAAADLPDDAAMAGVFHLQRFVATAGAGYHDHRILVCGGQALAAMTRRGEDWITNLRRGGRAEPFRPTAEMAALAVRAAEAVGAAFAGVDIIADQDGRAQVLEVNSMPGWRGLQGVTEVSIAERIAGALLGAC